MAANTTAIQPTTQQPSAQTRAATLIDIIEQLARFDGPPEKFLAAMLEVQCRIAPADAAGILRRSAQDRVDVLAVYPMLAPGATAPTWLARAVETSVQVSNSRESVVQPLPNQGGMYEPTPSRHLVLLPVHSGGLTGTAAFLVNSPNLAIIARARERLELTTSLLNLYDMRMTLARRNVDLQRLRESMEVLASLNEHSRMRAAAMALCNEVASRWKGERVAIGFLRGRYVKLAAMSHTEKFTRKMKLVQDIESAMEECLDQDVEIIHPPAPQVAYVSRSAHDLSNRHGPTTVLSLPLRRDGKVTAVLTIERAIDKPFTLDEVETLRLMCDLIAARLIELSETDRWFGAKLAAGTRKGVAVALGSEHTWLKLIMLAVLGFLCFAIFVKGPDRIDATCTIEATERQVITAPYQGYLFEIGTDVAFIDELQKADAAAIAADPAAVKKFDPNKKYYIKNGSKVRKGQVLARLDTAELALKIANARAELASHTTEANQALRDGKKAEEQIALAKADQVKAQINLLEYQRKQSEIVALIDGVIVKGTDLEQRIGVPVDPKTELFEIAPLETVRADLAVPENRIADVLANSTGELALAAKPGTYFTFEVERINPVAEVVDQANIFKVRATLTDQDLLKLALKEDWLKLGAKGVAKIEVGRKPYGYLWTRDLVNWLRMKLWF